MKYIVYKIILLILIVFLLIYVIRSCSAPTVKVYDRFIDVKSCDSIIKSANHFKRSGTSTGHIRTENKSRTSSTMFFHDGDNKTIDDLKRKVSKVLNVDPSNFEPIQVTKYDENQEYKYHYDYFGSSVKNQRRFTALLYLNTVPMINGGSTSFYFGNSIQPECGKLVCWENTDKHGNKLTNTLHSGKPIKDKYTKYIVTIWTRHNSLT